jgi:hypothetical protein
MLAPLMLTYLDFVRTGPGAIIVLVFALAVCIALVLWARRGEGWQRWPVLISAAVMTVVLVGIYGLALAAGWWGGGEYFKTPILVQMATLVPLSLAAWLVWLAGYGWLSARSGHAPLLYAVLALLVIPAAVMGEGARVAGGLIRPVTDGETWRLALVVVSLLLAPILLFEGVRRTLASDALP